MRSGDDGGGGHHDTANATSTATTSGVGGTGGAAAGGGGAAAGGGGAGGGDGGEGGGASCPSCAEAMETGIEPCPGTPEDAYYDLNTCACFVSNCAGPCTDFCNYGPVSQECMTCIQELSGGFGCPSEYDACQAN